MILIILVVTGLAFGSFINALIWRIEQQFLSQGTTAKIGAKKVDLSITTGRSVCTHCGHVLAPIDLIPFFSWLSLRGKCRYCKKPIQDSPWIELTTMVLFVLSYGLWPYQLHVVSDWVYFGFWLAILVGMVALFVYDVKHMILPDRIVFPLMLIGALQVVYHGAVNELEVGSTLGKMALGAAVGGGLFWVLFQISNGKWIGGGDVKLGFLIGIILGPRDSLVALMLGFYLAAFILLPFMLFGKVGRKSKIPFGPFLIVGFGVAMFWADDFVRLYNNIFQLS